MGLAYDGTGYGTDNDTGFSTQWQWVCLCIWHTMAYNGTGFVTGNGIWKHEGCSTLHFS